MTFILDPLTLLVILNTAVLAYIWWQLHIMAEDLDAFIDNHNRFIEAVLKTERELNDKNDI